MATRRDQTLLNKQAKFHPTSGGNGEVPAIELGGIWISAYLQDGRLCVSVDVEDQVAFPDCGEGGVPMRISVTDQVIYEADDAGRELVGPLRVPEPADLEPPDPGLQEDLRLIRKATTGDDC